MTSNARSILLWEILWFPFYGKRVALLSGKARSPAAFLALTVFWELLGYNRRIQERGEGERGRGGGDGERDRQGEKGETDRQTY